MKIVTARPADFCVVVCEWCDGFRKKFRNRSGARRRAYAAMEAHVKHSPRCKWAAMRISWGWDPE